MSEGIISRQGRYSVDETIVRFQALLLDKAIKLFAVIDHSGEAESVGLKMPVTKVLLFGNPKAGTPVMLAAPDVAIDLPLKLLVAEDAAGKVTLSWNDPKFLQHRHGFPEALIPNLSAVESLASSLVEE